MLNKLKMLSASLILLATSACAGGLTAPVVVSDYCRIAKPIGYDSTADTSATVAEVEAHNSRYVCVCEGDCPAPKRVANPDGAAREP